MFDCGSYLNPSSCREDHFWRGVQNTATFVVFQVTTMVLFSLVTALVLNMKIRGRGFFRAVYFFPVLLSPVVVALIWKWILQRDGLLNAALTSSAARKSCSSSIPSWAMFWAVFVSIWAHMGFYTLILLAGLQAIPADLYEAAEMDATPSWRVLWRITLPLLWPNLMVVIVLALIKAVQTFDEVFVLTGGGPGHRNAAGGPVHLRDRVRQPGAEFRPRRRRLGCSRRRAVRADADPARPDPARKERHEMASMALARHVSVGGGPAPLHWTDYAAYVYLALGVVLMFGPVLWLVLSSFKTQAACLEFPPSLLPMSHRTK